MKARTGLALLLRLEDRMSLRRRQQDLPTIRELLAVDVGMRLLDVGGGTGALAAAFLEVGASPVVLEPNPKKVAFGRVHHPRVEYRQGRAEQIPFPDGSFERAIAMVSVHHMEDPGRALREVHRILSPGGRFLVQEFLPAFAPGALTRRLFGRPHGGHHRYFDPQELTAVLVAAGFRNGVTRAGERLYYIIAER